MRKVKIPAISHEMAFISAHTDDADDIRDNKIHIPPSLKPLQELSDAVYERANKDVYELLYHLVRAIEEGVTGLLRINSWHYRQGWWQTWSEICLGLRGRKRSIGWAGLNVGYGKEGFRLIGSMNLRRGGLEGQKRLAQECKKKVKQVHLTRDDPKRYPGWSDSVIWFDKNLTVQTSLEELRSEVTKEAKKFFRVAKPLLKGT